MKWTDPKMGHLVTKQLEASSLHINKALPRVERSFRKHLIIKQVKSSPQKLFPKALQ